MIFPNVYLQLQTVTEGKTSGTKGPSSLLLASGHQVLNEPSPPFRIEETYSFAECEPSSKLCVLPSLQFHCLRR